MDELFQRALALHQQGRLAEARALYETVLHAQPRHLDALNLLGTIALQSGDAAGAIDLISRALDLQPGFANAYNNRAVALRELGRHDEALRDCELALRHDPGNAAAHVNRGVALKMLGQPEAALASYERAIELAPARADAHNNRGVVLREQRRLEAALASFDEAIRLQPAYPEAWVNRGSTLLEMRHLGEAVASYEEALRQKPDDVHAWSNLGVALHDLGQWDASMTALTRASTLDPRHADAWWNQGLLHLLQGRFDAGWPLYEWRRASKGAEADHRPLPRPRWVGAPSLAGRTILLTSEQGFGDTLQFCRYAPLLAARGAHVLLEAPQPLLGVLRALAGVTLVARGDPLPAFDFHCPLLSLPLAFGTRLATLPASPSYLRADDAKLQQWRERLGARRAPRVGLAWSGRATHRRDAERSVPLDALLRVLPPGIEYISLQNEVREADRAALAAAPQLRHFGEALREFDDTAALCEHMDLVLSVDTAVAHLAGALGRPTWVLLPFVPDFRWLLDREDSPWYPTMRLFRQDAACAWTPVLQRVGAELVRAVATP